MSARIVIDIRHIKDFGIGTYIRNLLEAIGKIDHENRYILVGREPDFHYVSSLPPNFERIHYEHGDAHWFEQIRFPLFLRKLAPDLYHIPLNAVSILMPRPYVVTIHDMGSLMYPTRKARASKYSLFRFRRGLQRADRVITVSGATRRDVEKLFAIPPERLRQIYNAPDPRFLAKARSGHLSPSKAEMHNRERLRLLERYQIDYPFLLYAGTIRPQKNIARLVEAFAVVKGELEDHPDYKDLRLIIIGDEIAQYPSVRHAVIQTRVEQRVRFLGFVPIDTLRIFYESAAAFVFPSLYEGFGLPPLEAMASGTPVVASSVSSLPEVVGDAAMIVNPENVFDIARGIKEVLLDMDLRERLIAKGYEQVGRFSWDHTAREVLATYKEVIEGR